MSETPIEDAYRARVDAGDITPDPAQEAVIPALERLRRDLEAPVARGFFGRAKPEPVRGVYLWGGVGRGKSMLMDLYAAHVDAAVRRVHFHAFMQDVHRGMGEARRREADDAIAPVADGVIEEIRGLALDEVQISDITDAMIVGRLFERLVGGGVGVAATSNRPPRDLYEDGLNRSVFEPFIDLIEQRFEVIEIGAGVDHRQGRIGRSYFYPVDAEARAAAAALWDDLGGEHAEPLVLRVQGREVTIPAYRSGAARARFWELCARPLGPADYLAIAEVTRVMVLEDVPRLGRSNFNEARRFVTLIDALYEARARLVVTAADRPGQLYVEGEGSFEFARTASRLAEMTSEGWGG